MVCPAGVRGNRCAATANSNANRDCDVPVAGIANQIVGRSPTDSDLRGAKLSRAKPRTGTARMCTMPLKLQMKKRLSLTPKRLPEFGNSTALRVRATNTTDASDERCECEVVVPACAGMTRKNAVSCRTRQDRRSHRNRAGSCLAPWSLFETTACTGSTGA